ncbi:hypothetical protein MW290_08425 [Aquincola tertiaricarbonis]|uniref:Uncharacterized protein n=1 Tax=Aquincola tertiaricarbonis TaxID=391953 RepID=A0ABY4RYT1_AQUTE|nr:hypothetical protein [Aquincola tertiaricarbonis]URI05963.1 hypothetical protein MW290_08425 [Aquincola tertiaricarbonis]
MTYPLNSQKDEPRVATQDGGDRTRAGSNYGDYVPPPERVHVQSALPDAQLPPDVAPEDPDAELIKAQHAQRAARPAQASIEGESEAGEEDPGAADEVLREPSSGPEGVVPRKPL